MKKIFIILTTLFLFSCNNPESKMRTEIKKYLDKNSKDSKTYEFVELIIKDTVIEGELAKIMFERYQSLFDRNLISLKTENLRIEELKSKKIKYKTKTFDELISEVKQYTNKTENQNKEYLIEIEKNKKVLGSKKVLGYNVSHKFKMNDEFGTFGLSKVFIQFDKDYNLLTFHKDSDILISE